MREPRGITLLEILVVIGISMMMLALGTFASIDEFRLIGIRQDRESLLDALLLARARAQYGGCASDTCTLPEPHGVRIQRDVFVVFEGSSYDQRDRSSEYPFPRASDVEFEGSQEFVFLAGSGAGALEGSARAEAPIPFSIGISEDGLVVEEEL